MDETRSYHRKVKQPVNRSAVKDAETEGARGTRDMTCVSDTQQRRVKREGSQGEFLQHSQFKKVDLGHLNQLTKPAAPSFSPAAQALNKTEVVVGSTGGQTLWGNVGPWDKTPRPPCLAHLTLQ